MKKTYEKPMVEFVDFRIDTDIMNDNYTDDSGDYGNREAFVFEEE